MELQLKKDLCFLDIEATGLNVIRDRIVQIALIKYFANGTPPEELTLLINPGIPIAAEAMQIHGLTPKDLANKPTFGQVAQQLYDFIGGADLAGYNSNRFDVPLLMEEFARVGYEFNIDHRKLIDVQRIFYKMEPRTLKAALRFYCQQELDDAHDALADVKATIAVFKGQLTMYEGKDLLDEDGSIIPAPIVNDMQVLHNFTNDANMLDATQKFRRDHTGTIVFNFGKFIGQPAAPILYEDRQYYHWMLNKEFSSQVKQLVKKIVKDYEQTLRQ